MKPIKSIKRWEALMLTRVEKNGLKFFTKKISKTLSIFSMKNRGFFEGLHKGRFDLQPSI